MNRITLNVNVGKERKLIIDLPDDVPEGLLKITIESPEPSPSEDAKITREELQAQLAAAGLLANLADWEIPDDLGSSTEEDLEELDRLITSPLNVDAFLDEERGEY